MKDVKVDVPALPIGYAGYVGRERSSSVGAWIGHAQSVISRNRHSFVASLSKFYSAHKVLCFFLPLVVLSVFSLSAAIAVVGVKLVCSILEKEGGAE